MLDPEALYTTNADQWDVVAGHAPVMLHLLQGYVDAGGVSRNLAEHLLMQCPHEVVAEFDCDQLHDYRSRRPPMTFDVNTWVEVEMPRLVLHRMTDDAGRDFLLLEGPEPDSQWERACTAILDLAGRLGVTQFVTATGTPFGVPHTRPVLVTAHATSPELVGENPMPFERVQVPGSFSTLLEYRAGQRGLLGRGFVTYVPHYLAQGAFTPATVTALDRVMDAAGLVLPRDPLAGTVQATLDALENEMAGDEDLPALIATLEAQYDDLARQGQRSVPSADEIGAAAERFLAERDDEGEGS
ncbi:PAC2 family protein [Nigerium sp.]|uniref:PAC2 family protein n=1 Tax=Nigerium sp. TaxID=2042655 RepID=UPI003221F477